MRIHLPTIPILFIVICLAHQHAQTISTFGVLNTPKQRAAPNLNLVNKQRPRDNNHAGLASVRRDAGEAVVIVFDSEHNTCR